ncbi:MAG TPA: U32 family peptidase [Candidatus Nanoarchaeia archaeon]|nr:U32 family peptidase [Candidatus Nanoarchaeia archaeon]
MNKIKLELLAPAKDLATGKLAILAGADAVYIGGPGFGARAAAGNSWEDVKALLDFAHQYYAKVYVALNTIFFDNEIEEVKSFINKADEIGVDALIIQDMGILEMDLPPIPLIASTQCDNSTVEQIKFLAEAGISRVILARELSLGEIKNISEQITQPTPSRAARSTPPGEGNIISLEAFVHGALCVSQSGHCYFSQAVCGKSANRGQCAQICRQPFDLIDAEGKILAQNKYLLSLKDFNLSGSLADLVEAGVTFFKIEGRLKDPAYVANVTAKYRQELDKIIAASAGKYVRAASGKIELGFQPDLNKTFNRGYTEYFLRGRQGEIISPLTQKSLGELIGKVKSAERSHFGLDQKHDLKNGDGICWFDRDGQLVGTNINLVRDGKIYPNKVLPLSVGAEIYRNENPSFEKAVERGVSRRVSVDFIIKETKAGFNLEAIDEDGNSVSLKLPAKLETAAKPELSLKNWREQLGKLGETIFYAREIIFDWSKPYFVPLSVLNDWRRKLALALLKKRLRSYPRVKVDHRKTNHPFYRDKLDYSFNAANKLARAFYLRHGVKKIDPAFELQNDHRDRKLMTCRHCLKYWLGFCPRKGKAIPDFQEPLYLIQNKRKFRLNFDCGNCQMEIYQT